MKRPDKKDYPDGTVKVSAIETLIVPNESYIQQLEKYADHLESEQNKSEELGTHVDNLEKELLKPFEMRLHEFRAQASGGFDVTMESEFMRASVVGFIKMMNSMEGADNFLTLTVNHVGEMYDLRVSRKYGKSPEDLVMELKKKIEDLENKQ